MSIKDFTCYAKQYAKYFSNHLPPSSRYSWSYCVCLPSRILLISASVRSTTNITKYNAKNIVVVFRNPSVWTNAPASVGPTKFPNENADSQIPKVLI